MQLRAFWVLVGMLVAAAVGAANEQSIAERLETSKVAVAAPEDRRFLGDQIDLILEVEGLETVFVSTRPGQFMFLTIPAGADRKWVRKYGLVLIPLNAKGKRVRSYDELNLVSDGAVVFQLNIFCIEETPPGEIENELPPVDPNIEGGCQPRERDFQFSDDIKEFRGRAINLKQGDLVMFDRVFLNDWKQPIFSNSVAVEILKYTRGAVAKLEPLLDQYPLNAVRCLEEQRFEFCGCRVAIGQQVRSTGCAKLTP